MARFVKPAPLRARICVCSSKDNTVPRSFFEEQITPAICSTIFPAKSTQSLKRNGDKSDILGLIHAFVTKKSFRKRAVLLDVIFQKE